MKQTDFFIITKASPKHGHGHVIRCLHLANEIRKQNKIVAFKVSNNYTNRLLTQFNETPITVQSPPHYIIRDIPEDNPTKEVLEEINNNSKVMLIDDHGPTRTMVDIATDSMTTPPLKLQYSHGPRTKYLYGLQYALVNPLFANYHKKALNKKTKTPRLFICIGGNDFDHTTTNIVHALHKAGFRGPATIIVPNNIDINDITTLTNNWNDTINLQNTNEIAHYMQFCDLAITKLGMVMLEAFCVGLGCILIQPSLAHEKLNNELSNYYKNWPVIDLGLAKNISPKSCAKHIIETLTNEVKISEMAFSAASLIDGNGIKRILSHLLEEN